MFSSSPSTNLQHDQQFPSIIRTRSQQGPLLAPVDLYASPFKKAILNHNHSTDKTESETKTGNILQGITANNTHHETSFSPSRKKRAFSPSFARNDNAGKRTRVLVQSSKINSLPRGRSEESLGTPHKGDSSTPVKPSPRTMSYGSPAKGLLHMDFTRVPSSPSKSNGSPNKTFKITKDDGYTMRVPITPVRPMAGPSTPIKVPPRLSLVKTQSRAKGKAKSSGVTSRVPLTRLAAKRGLRRISSFTGLSPGAPSGGSNASPPSLNSVEASNAAAATYVQSGTEKRSLVTSSLLSSENAPVHGGGSSRVPASSGSGSPKKPTPLTSLSTALQKLTAAPPTAPLPRPRPNPTLGFARPSLIPTPIPPPSNRQEEDVHVGIQTPGCSQSPVVLQRSKTLGHAQLNRMNTGMGKIGLPLRRPSTADSNGRSLPWVGAPFASKQTTLSTVPASPSRSAAPTEAETTRDATNDVLDVDAWIPSDCNGNGKGREKVETAMKKLEYFVPLADEPRTKEHGLVELVSPSRRASQASMLLTQSLSLPRGPTGRHTARSVSASIAVQPIPRTPVKTRGRTKGLPPAPQAASDGVATAKPEDPMGGKRSNARMPGSLDVLKDCIIFVDVRTEEGEDAAALFVDMLRGLGARILAKPGKSCTHLVYKAGLPSTITRYNLLPEPRPLPVSIGWVVECVEKRAHVDETRFLVNLNEIGVAGGIQRRRSMQPKQMRTLTLGQLDDGEPADISVRADSSFTSEEPSASAFSFTNLSPHTRSPNDNLPPLERARQRSFRLPQE